MADELEPKVRAKAICSAIRRTRRTLYGAIRNKRFPPPDHPARRRGEPDLWNESTARSGIKAFLDGSVSVTTDGAA